MKIPKNVAILFIGLGKYSLFWDRFYKSVQRNFLPDIDKHYFIFSDEELLDYPSGDETFIKTEAFSVPRDIKLHKFHFIKHAWEEIKRYEYVAYFDADNVVRQKVEPEAIFDNDKPLIGVVHPWGSIRNSKSKFESDPISAAALKEEEIDIPYHQSCFWGGRTDEVEKMVNECYRTLKHDIKIEHKNEHNICDEVHVNRYFALNKDKLHSLGREWANPGEAYQSERKSHKESFGKDMIISHDNTNQTYKNSLEFLEQQSRIKQNFSFAGWAQVKDNTKATFEMLKKFKGTNPNAKVHVTVTGDKDYKDIIETFGCSFDIEEKSSIQSWTSGNRVVKHDIWQLFQSLKRVCELYLNEEWIVLLEDDVESFSPPSEPPSHSFGGPNGPSFTPELREGIREKFPKKELPQRYTGCGGSILRREDFLKALKMMTKGEWKKYAKLDERLNHYADISISFLLVHGGFEIGLWKEFTGWTDQHKKTFAFAHGNKEFYRKDLTKEDLKEMDYIKYSGIYINPFMNSTVKEVFVPKGRMNSVQRHSFFEYIIKKEGVCLDVGCRDFVFSNYIKNRCSKVIALDPAKDVVSPNDDKIDFINSALTASAVGEVFLVRSGRNSSHFVSYENISSDCLKVPNLHIENLMRMFNIFEFELVKLSCVGSEYALVNWLAERPVAKQISVEFYDWRGQNPYKNPEQYYQKLFNKLEKTYHVAKHERSHKPHESQGAYNYDDSLFVRK